MQATIIGKSRFMTWILFKFTMTNVMFTITNGLYRF